MKSIFITGANRGIGLGIAKTLLEKGHIVYCGIRNIEKGKLALDDAINRENARFIEIDVSYDAAINLLKQKLEKDNLSIDVLINNAGVMSENSSVETSNLDETRRVFDTNFFGVWNLTQTLLPFMKKSRDPRIINISSGMGAHDDLVGGYSAYRLSKAALNDLTIQLSNELGNQFKVNAVCPGWVRTDMGGSGASRSIEKGADTPVWLATADEIPSGKFLRDREVIPW